MSSPRRSRALCERQSARMRGGIFFKLIFLMFLAAVVFVLYLLRAPLLTAAGNFWIVNDPLVPASAIIVLSDDDVAGDRAIRAAELYHDHYAATVVASGRMLRSYASVSDLMDHDLKDHGVPSSAITIFHHNAQNTLDEAKALRMLVGENHWDRIIVVTSNYHTRRARYIFRRVFPSNVAVEVEAAKDVTYDPDSWWQSREGLKLFFHELGGMLVAFWEVRRTANPSGTVVFMSAYAPAFSR